MNLISHFQLRVSPLLPLYLGVGIVALLPAGFLCATRPEDLPYYFIIPIVFVILCCARRSYLLTIGLMIVLAGAVAVGPWGKNPGMTEEAALTLALTSAAALVISGGIHRLEKDQARAEAILQSHPAGRATEPAQANASARRDHPHCIIDPETLKDLRSIETDEDSGLLTEVYSTFIGDAGARLHSLHDALGQRDLERFRRLAHALKGSACMVGACSVAVTCDPLERLRDADVPEPAVSLLGKLERELDAVTLHLHSTLLATEPGSPTDRTSAAATR